ncbi:MAG: hypothetical protein HYX75_00075 [Acidobacteria bacterium]|nr:hypothetical protein [Acidobacteriota bacterium]
MGIHLWFLLACAGLGLCTMSSPSWSARLGLLMMVLCALSIPARLTSTADRKSSPWVCILTILATLGFFLEIMRIADTAADGKWFEWLEKAQPVLRIALGLVMLACVIAAYVEMLRRRKSSNV